MKLLRKINNKQNILLGIFFILFTLSYTTNVFRISESNLFHHFERQPEGLVVGRLIRSAQDGVFSHGGLTGINYNSTTERSTNQYTADLAAQHDIYITVQDVPDSYQAYKSQSGGQGIILSIFQEILPLDNAKKLMVFRGINAILIALVFCLFARWIYREFGFVASLVTLLLIFFSPWLNMFSHNLWWVLWNFYLPFLTVLLGLEYKYKNPEKMSEMKVLGLLFLATFLKCFLTGFEFMTTTLVAAICPIVYYCYLEKKNIIQFIVASAKASVCMLAAVLAQMVMLVTQIKFIDGSFSAGISHITGSFTKRTETEDVSFFEVFKMYLQDDAFSLGFLSNRFQISFGILLLFIVFVSIIVYFKNKDNRSIEALLIATLFSILAPLSWLIVFKQHSFEHPHMDYIIWYMPFLLYAFAIIGVVFSKLIPKLKPKQIQTKNTNAKNNL